MSTHLVAYYESQAAATLTPVAAVPDTTITIPTRDRIRIPEGRTALYRAGALGSDLTRAQIVAPSLETRRETLEIIPHERGSDAFALAGPRYYKPMREVEFVSGEHVEVQVVQDSGGADLEIVLLWLKPPGPLPDMPAGPILTARATGTTTLVAGSWTATTLTLEKELAAGTYALVGFLAMSATGIAARVAIEGQVNRPGVPVLPGAEEDARDFHPDVIEDFIGYEMGRFTNETIPQVEFLASAGDTAETVIFYLVRVS